MSTNAIIVIEGINFAEVYKHWDGNPEATLPWLEKFNKDFTEDRGDDPSYKFASLLKNIGKYAKEFGLDTSENTGWGVVKPNSMSGIEFVYTLKGDGSVEYKAVH